MIDETGEEKMHSGEMASETAGRTGQRGGAKMRVSPELQELMHMLSSLEHQFSREDGEE